MKISIIGCGYVGTVTGVCFANFGHDIVFYDIDEKKLDLLARGESPIYEPSLDDLIQKNRQRLVTTSDLTAAVRDTDITFICVGTPSRDDGSIDLTYVLSAGATIGKALRETPDFHPIIVKSTVFPGSTEGPIRSALEEASGKQAFVDFGLGSNPEFLREGNAVHDFCVPDRIVLGAKDARTMRALGDLYASFTCPKIETSIRTAEMIKYTSNAFLATKISFANEIGNLAKKLGIDAEEVFAGVGLDNRIGPAFFRTGIGFGGSCFPKDVRALIAGAGDHDEDLQILHAALRVNEDQPLKLVRLLQAHIPDLKGRRIGVLGLAFKPNTDDIRESRAIPVIRALLDAGAEVVAYDPLAMEASLRSSRRSSTHPRHRLSSRPTPS
jgi:UDPglucose 6-dehydrogenase